MARYKVQTNYVQTEPGYHHKLTTDFKICLEGMRAKERFKKTKQNLAFPNVRQRSGVLHKPLAHHPREVCVNK